MAVTALSEFTLSWSTTMRKPHLQSLGVYFRCAKMYHQIIFYEKPHLWKPLQFWKSVNISVTRVCPWLWWFRQLVTNGKLLGNTNRNIYIYRCAMLFFKMNTNYDISRHWCNCISKHIVLTMQNIYILHCKRRVIPVSETIWTMNI